MWASVFLFFVKNFKFDCVTYHLTILNVNFNLEARAVGDNDSSIQMM